MQVLFCGFGWKTKSHLCRQVLSVCEHLLQSSDGEAVSQDEAAHTHVRWDILRERKKQ